MLTFDRRQEIERRLRIGERRHRLITNARVNNWLARFHHAREQGAAQ